MMTKIPELQELATKLVGDGQSPNLYFVSKEGVNICVTRFFETAYTLWQAISRERECETSLEDRRHGTLADVAPDPERGPGLFRQDHCHALGLTR